MRQKKSTTKTDQQKVKLQRNSSSNSTSTNAATDQLILSDSERADLRFEYEQLRQEIVHNDTLTLQIVGAILVLSGALLPIAFSNSVTIPDRWLLFLGMEIIAYQGLRQNTDRLRGTLVAASYNKVFIESRLENVKWETRLQLFLDNSNRGGDLIAHQVWIYAMLMAGNFYFAQHFFWQKYSTLSFTGFPSLRFLTSSHISWIGFGISALFFIQQFWMSSTLNRKHTRYFDLEWLAIRGGKSN